jgi:hypothetical protein
MYPAMELAEAIGISRHRFFKLVRMQGIVTYGVGRATLIPLSEVKDKLEPVWDAICLAEELRNRGRS